MLCRESLCTVLLPSTHRQSGNEKSYISKSSSLSHIQLSPSCPCPQDCLSHMLTALVPKDHRDGGSPCHGNYHRGTQHLHSPGNVSSPVPTGLENSRVLAKTKCCLLRSSCLKAPEGHPGGSTCTLDSCQGAVILYPQQLPKGQIKGRTCNHHSTGHKNIVQQLQ